MSICLSLFCIDGDARHSRSCWMFLLFFFLVDESRIVDRYSFLSFNVDMSLSLLFLSFILSLLSRVRSFVLLLFRSGTLASDRGRAAAAKREKEKCNRSKLSKASSAYINEERRTTTTTSTNRREEKKENSSSSCSMRQRCVWCTTESGRRV